ncbi:MAG TPA: TolC family protein, partial [Sandaracinaceae bacterium LLY-WYZ-13_1]|nr:TolC family protein [Sandaracinaceae bacterium LLY-WYZ-13_1]
LCRPALCRPALCLPALCLLFLVPVPAAAQDEAGTERASVPSEDSTPAERAADGEIPAPPRDAFELGDAIAEGPSLTAAEAARRAVDASPSLDEARALSRAAEASVARARAAMLPRLELSAQYTHLDGFPDGRIELGTDPEALAAARMLADRVSDPAARALWQGQIESQADGGVSIEVPRDRFTFGARLTWPVSDLFFAVMPAVDAAEAGARAREHQIEAAEAQVRRSALEAYYQLARARGGLAVAEEARRQSEAQRAQIEAAVRAGLLTEANRLGAEARVASAGEAVASARAGVAIADAALRELLGDADGAPYGIADPVLDRGNGSAPSVRDANARALDQRAELRALRQSLEAQRAAGRVSDASGYPHLALFAGADVSNPSPYVIPPTAEFQPAWQVGAVLSWSPNDTLNAVHRGDELGAEAAAIESRIAQLERGVRLEVRRAHAQLAAARERLDAARAAREAAQAAYEGRLAQLRAGRATVGDLFAAEGQLHRARLAELDAAVQIRLARTHLDYATGDL